MDNSIALTVVWAEKDTQQIIKFGRQMTVAQACVLALTEFGQDPSLADMYGFLRQSMHGGYDIWVDPKATIGTSGLRNGQIVQFAPKQRPLKIRLIDGSEKTVRTVKIDESLPVGAIVHNVCQRIGIHNHEEYSFMLDEKAASPQDTRRSKKETLVDLRKRMADDEKWLQHELTLRAQGVMPDQVLVLRKKFFFSDQEINRDDPVQVNLVYGQAKDSIVKGEHPCTLDEAVQFAAMQVHIEHGDHNPDRHKPGYLDDLRAVLPAEYVKVKGVEKKIYAEHKKLVGQPELNIKFKYTTMCRALKTYGITFFSVREKVKGKNKLIPRLLGVTRESVMRMDEKTKEVLKTWPLTTVKRWVASPNSFTLDFGTYSDYYSVQTLEGDKISQLIAGYIDIILKKRRQQDRRESASSMAAQSGNTTSQLARAERVNLRGSKATQMNVRQSASGHASLRPRLRSSAQAQSTLANHISRANRVFVLAGKKIASPATLPPLGESASAHRWREEKDLLARQNVAAEVAAILSATANIVTLTTARSDNTKVNFTAVGASISTLASNMRSAAEDVAMLMALNPVQADNFKSALEQLSSHLRSFVDTVAPTERGIMNRQNILSSANQVGQSGSALLSLAQAAEVSDEKQSHIMGLTKAIANATSVLVDRAKTVAGKCDDAVLQSSVITAAKTTAVATTQLGTCSKMLVPSIHSALCQEQLQESARALAASVETLVSAAQNACADEQAVGELAHAATAVSDALGQLIQGINEVVVVVGNTASTGGSRSRAGTASGAATGTYATLGASVSPMFERACEEILQSADALPRRLGDPRQMVATAKQLAKATAVVVSEVKARANRETDPTKQQEHLKTARRLADATTRLVEATKKASQNPKSKKAQQALLDAASNLRDVTKATASDVILKRAITGLVTSAKQSAASVTQLISAVHATDDLVRESSTRERLAAQCQHIRGQTARLITAIRGARRDPMNAAAQMDLVNKAQDFLAPAKRLAEAARNVAPTFTDAAATMQVTNCARSVNAALADLKSSIASTADASDSLQLSHAVESVLTLGSSLAQLDAMAEQGQLAAMPGDDPAEAVRRIMASIHAVKTRIKQFQAAVKQGNEDFVNKCANAMAKALKELTVAVQVFAASTPASEQQRAILAHARAVMQQAAQLLMEGRKLVSGAEAGSGGKMSAAAMAEVKAASKQLLESLSQLASDLPGQRSAQQCAQQVHKQAKPLTQSKGFSVQAQGPEVFQQHSATVMSAANALSQVVSEVSDKALLGGPDEVAAASQRLVEVHKSFVSAGLTLAGACETQEDAKDLLSFLQSISTNAEKLLKLGAATAVDPTDNSQRNLLSSAVRGISSSINNLLTACTQSAPGQKQCDKAIRTVQAAAASLESPTSAISASSYFTCVDDVLTKTRDLGSALAEVAGHCKNRDTDRFNSALQHATDAVVGLCEDAAQAAYLVAVSDVSSSGGSGGGALDQAGVIRSKEAIEHACATLVSCTSSQQEVMAAAKRIATDTTSLCHLCRAAAEQTTNPVVSQQLVEVSTAISGATRDVIANAKQLASSMTPEARAACQESSAQLNEVVDQLLQLATDADADASGAGAAAFSEEAKARQKPFCTAGRDVAEASCKLITAAKSLIANPRDPPKWEELGQHSKTVSQSVQALVSAMQDNAPGQRECDNTAYEIGQLLHDLQETEYACQSGTLEVADDETMGGFQEEIVGMAANLREACDALKTGGTSDPARLAHAAEATRTIADSLLTSMIGAISHIKDSEVQQSVCAQGRTLLEGVSQLVHAARDCGGNPDEKTKHRIVARARENLDKGITEFCNTIGQLTNETGVAAGNLNNINRALDKLELGEAAEFTTAQNFVDYQDSANKHTRKMATKAQDMLSKALTEPEEVPALATDLTNQLLALISDTTGALKGLPSDKFATQLKGAVRDLGVACSNLVGSAGLLQQRPTDQVAKQEVADSAREVSRQVQSVVAQLQAGSRGTQACIDACVKVEDTVTDLETTLMFASAGSLMPDAQTTFTAEQGQIRDKAKQLVEQTKALVTATAESQDDLAAAAEKLNTNFDALVESLKLGAASLGPDQVDAQVLLLNAARDVGATLAELLTTTKSVSGNPHDDAAVKKLGEQARTMATNISGLLKTVSGIDDGAQRVTQALESAMQAIEREETSSSLVDEDVKDEDAVGNLIAASRPVTSAVTKLVTAMGSGQVDRLTGAANDVRKAVIDLMKAAEVASVVSEASTGRDEVQSASKGCAAAVRGLLGVAASLAGRPATSDAKKQALEWSRQVASNLAEVGQAAQNLKGDDWVDPTDPNVVAEQELLTAAAAIDSAADKLSVMQPRAEVQVEDLPFEEQILGAAKSIATATSSLVKAANAAQKEMADTMPFSGDYYSEEAQWSASMVSAAKLVAFATQNLCEAANATVQGGSADEKLVASAKSVANSTAQLMLACRAKMDAQSPTAKRLLAAGSAVKKAADHLVESAKTALEEAQEADMSLDERPVQSMRQEIEAVEAVLKQERELEAAKRNLAKLRATKYKKGKSTWAASLRLSKHME
ncbi:Tln1 protein [Salpingoeca rosetta]|uniref:Tln1 protein n=1 Tax=Salpingoeca rosetta (strain ATCC 50818 / BSB-021) TaxID=946362 RepID=F2U141_SALR5|nr:Tln1 protein [Salpingoeca rosetta]EGD80615.1 Tln1 protein [Salpingoeca rosetta]|eukprot:XP_004997176.1 Tln1 protein [Salpingoeca rosetta]